MIFNKKIKYILLFLAMSVGASHSVQAYWLTDMAKPLTQLLVDNKLVTALAFSTAFLSILCYALQQKNKKLRNHIINQEELLSHIIQQEELLQKANMLIKEVIVKENAQKAIRLVENLLTLSGLLPYNPNGVNNNEIQNL